MDAAEEKTVQENGEATTTEETQSTEQTFEERLDGLFTGLGSDDEEEVVRSKEGVEALFGELSDVAGRGDADADRDATGKLDKVRERLEVFSAGQSDEKPATTADGLGEEGEKPAEQKTEAEQALEKFGITYKGQRHEVDDKGRLLGFGNTGELKAAFLKTGFQLRDLQSERDSLSTKLQEAAAKIAEYEAKGTVQSPSIPPEGQPTTPTTPSAPEGAEDRPQRPVAPTYPELSTLDPFEQTPEDRQKLQDYNKAMSQFSSDMTSYLEYVESHPSVKYEMPPEKERELEELKSFVGENKSYWEKMREASQKEEQAARNREHWSRLSDFQSAHPEYKTPQPIEKTHEAMVQWMDTIAGLNNVQRPSTSQNLSDPQWQTYLSQRNAVVDRYLAGDQAVVSNAEGFKPPDGHEQYLKLAELEAVRREYISNGPLKDTAKLEDAYLLHLRDSGEMPQVLDTVRQQAEESGRRAVVDAISEHSNSAQVISPESSGGPSAEEVYGIPEADIDWFQGIGTSEFERLSSDGHKRYNGIKQKLERVLRGSYA